MVPPSPLPGGGYAHGFAIAAKANPTDEEKACAGLFVAWATSKEYGALVAKTDGIANVPPGTRASTYSDAYMQAAPFAGWQEASRFGPEAARQPPPSPSSSSPRSARRPRPVDPLSTWRPRPRPRLTSHRSRGLGRLALAGEIGRWKQGSTPKAQPPRKRSGKRTAKHTDAGKPLLGARRRSKAPRYRRRNLSGFRTAGARGRRSFRCNTRP